jgi:DNA-binding NarL/FixJ family response regulator
LAEAKSESSSKQDKDNKMIRIILADDHPLMREALRNRLSTQRDFEVIAEASDGEEAVKLASKLIPDVVIMDISMPKLNGLEATKRIKANCPTINVLALTVHSDVHSDKELILSILQAGACGYLTKSVYGDEVVQAIRTLVSGGTVLSSSISRQIFKHAFNIFPEHLSLAAGDRITTRELAILRLVAGGASNKDIALKLDIGIPTVKSHLVDLFLKLNVESRTEAVAASLREGILTLDDLQ